MHRVLAIGRVSTFAGRPSCRPGPGWPPAAASCAGRSQPSLARSTRRWPATAPPSRRDGRPGGPFGATPHAFNRVCHEHAIAHVPAKPRHPWTDGPAERRNRTVQEATVKTPRCETLERIQAHVLAFVTARTFAKHRKRPRWRAPFQAVCDAWTNDPAPFNINPHHRSPGPSTLGLAWLGLAVCSADADKGTRVSWEYHRQ